MRFFALIFMFYNTCLADSLISLDQAAIESVAGSYDTPYYGRRLATDLEISQDEATTFTPPIARLLLMAGYSLTSDHGREVLSCRSNIKENYDSFTWWRMQEEFKKELPKRDVRIDENIGEMAHRLAKTPVTESAKRREFLMSHQVRRR